MNLVLFFLVYLPLTLIVGLALGSFQAPGLDRSLPYEFFLWFVVALQLIGPTLLVYLVALLVLRAAARYLPSGVSSRRRLISAALVGVALPTTQAISWGALQLSIEWFLIAVLPAGLLGYLVAPLGKTAIHPGTMSEPNCET